MTTCPITHMSMTEELYNNLPNKAYVDDRGAVQ